MSLNEMLMTWPRERLVKELAQQAKENAALRERAARLECELFWLKVPMSADPAVEMNVVLLRARSAVGLKKYGVTMADSKLPLRAWLVHALEESLDHANYLQRAMLEIDQVAAPAGETPP